MSDTLAQQCANYQLGRNDALDRKRAGHSLPRAEDGTRLSTEAIQSSYPHYLLGHRTWKRNNPGMHLAAMDSCVVLI